VRAQTHPYLAQHHAGVLTRGSLLPASLPRASVAMDTDSWDPIVGPVFFHPRATQDRVCGHRPAPCLTVRDEP
jgi:hypothetical protein